MKKTVDDNVDFSALKSTARLVAKELVARGVEVYVVSSAHGLIKYKHGGRWHYLRSVLSDKESAVASNITRNKVLTTLFCRHIGVKCPEIWDTIEPLENFIKRFGLVVVKPVSGAHGAGITTGINSVKGAESAIDYALSKGASDYFIQQQVGGQDCRVVCIDGNVVAALRRVPASVIGDGKSNLKRLIELENQRPERGESLQSSYLKIDMSAAKSYLGDRLDDEIPKKGEKVQVVGVSNISLGGDGEDITDIIPESMIETSKNLARELQMGIVGIDFMWDEEASSEAYVLEVNAVPGIDIHETPRYGKPRNVVKKFVDYILK